MKAVLISIQPKWCELIASGKKTVEVRKTAPKEVPFKAYVYCTKGKQAMIFESNKNACLTWTQEVIGEFICDKVEKFIVGSLRSDDIEELACLSYTELINYLYKPCELDGKTAKQGYAWHISELKIYDEPIELGEFKKYNRVCKFSDLGYAIPDCKTCRDCNLTRPPQSWCYVEE